MLQQGQMANMDQILLLFALDDGLMYSGKGAEKVWCRTVVSGLDKRQFTAQLTVFGDYVSQVRPTLILQSECKRIKSDEGCRWDKRVNVYFQKNIGCGKVIMKKPTSDEWCNIFTNPETPGSSGKLLSQMFDIDRSKSRK